MCSSNQNALWRPGEGLNPLQATVVQIADSSCHIAAMYVCRAYVVGHRCTRVSVRVSRAAI